MFRSVVDSANKSEQRFGQTLNSLQQNELFVQQNEIFLYKLNKTMWKFLKTLSLTCAAAAAIV